MTGNPLLVFGQDYKNDTYFRNMADLFESFNLFYDPSNEQDEPDYIKDCEQEYLSSCCPL